MHLLIYYNMGSKSAIGIGNGICFKQVRDKGGGSYIDPLVRDSIVGLWKSDQNTNESPTRNIIKNTIKGKGGDLELLNFGYKLNSGYGKYEEDFTDWIIYPNIKVTDSVITTDGNFKSSWFIYKHSSESKINEMNIKVSGIPKGGKILYFYISDETANLPIAYTIPKDGIYHLPESKINNNRASVGFTVESRYDWNNIRIEQIPSFEGAFVTDGKDDLITSTKTVKEMLGGSNVCTVVSMIHQINLSADVNTSINNIRSESVAHVCARHLNTAYGKTGIFGYSKQLNTTSNPTLINNILGDKKDYIADGNSVIDTTDKYFVQGYKYNDSLYELSEVAVYWTFISNKVLTTDEINQIIAYFKLDKYVTPQVIYVVKRQGLTNDTPDADWYLKDFSGNGHDMTLYNFAKKLGSGIGKYEVDFNTWTPQSYVADSAYTSNKLHITNIKGGNAILYTKKGANAMKVKITGIQSFNLVYRYIAENDVWKALEVDRDGIYELPASTTTTKTYYTGFTVPYYTGDCDITIEQIPDYEGALVSDGINDYGKVENLPIYKDYTVVADREMLGTTNGGVFLKGEDFKEGAFSFDYTNESSSFGGSVQKLVDTKRLISYQSKYVNNGININARTATDTDKLWLAKLGNPNRYSKLALWSLLLFPYSLSEFLLERQLKKYKLGTLYPDMVEWRPIAKSNIPYKQIDYFIKRSGAYVRLNPGDYFQSTEDIIVRVTPIRDWQLDVVSSIKVNGKNEVISVNSSYAQTAPIHIDKSPQKIDITIDEYIRYEDIVQPYPAIINLKQDGKTITWGDKLKVGSDIVFVESANLLPELYTVSDTRYNGVTLYPNTIIKVEKSMVFDNARTYLKANEPNCILSPNRLRIPNSSYKILGYIPDLTGKGNHGKLNNFAYTEDSGVASDGSIKIDGTDDHITISNIIGGKCIMAKVTVNRNSGIIYDQRRANVPNKSWMQLNPSSVIFEQNAVSTYIDGILNHNVTGSDLVSKTVNLTCELEIGDTSGTYKPTIGSSYAVGYTTDINLYEFMLFPDVPDEEEIKELNDIIGIEGGYVERPEYYWDAYGKKNTDTDRNLIADQVSKDVANALEVKNVAYNSESGYTDNNGLLLDGVEDHAVNTVIPAVTDFTIIGKRISQASTNDTMFITKGQDGVVANSALGLEYRNINGEYVYSFGASTNVESIPDLITYCTPTNYNGKVLTRGNVQDTNGIQIGKFDIKYWKGVFYKLMFYTKTIDQLSINMLKNLFERDELIDITNPIFKKKEL